MRPRLALLLGALVVPVLPAAPATAVDPNIICVGPLVSPCTDAAASIAEAITKAGADVGATTIKVPPGTYTGGPYVLDGNASPLTLEGSGSGTGPSATVLSLDPGGAETYLTMNHASVRGVRVVMNGTQSTDDKGVVATGSSSLQNVIIISSGAITGATGLHATGSSATNVTVNLLQGADNTGVVGGGGSSYVDSTWNAETGYRLSGGVDVVSRVTIRNITAAGAVVDAGTLLMDDSVIDLESSNATGLLAAGAGTTTAGISANHVTVVGGAVGSTGVLADATVPTARQTSTINLTNSIIRGPGTSIRAQAGNNGAQGGNSVATVDTSYTDYVTTAAAPGPNGTAAVNLGDGNLVNVDPQFLDPADENYALRAGSPVVDKGQLGAGPPNLDRAGKARVVDGDGDGNRVRDMGAYELTDTVPPKTTITGGPTGATNDNTPVFTFRSGPDATFQCQVDGSAYQPCGSPVTTHPLPDGAHTFTVRAIDSALNVEPAPPTRSFTVDTTRPSTVLVKHPPKRFFRPKVKFKFSSHEAKAKFQCKVDGQPWRTCKSPFTYSVKVGKHRLLVRAIDAAGNLDRTPVRYKFKRLKRR